MAIKTATSTNVPSNCIDNVSKPEKKNQHNGGITMRHPLHSQQETRTTEPCRIKGESLKPLGLAKELTSNGTEFDSMHISDRDHSREASPAKRRQHLKNGEIF